MTPDDIIFTSTAYSTFL